MTVARFHCPCIRSLPGSSPHAPHRFDHGTDFRLHLQFSAYGLRASRRGNNCPSSFFLLENEHAVPAKSVRVCCYAAVSPVTLSDLVDLISKPPSACSAGTASGPFRARRTHALRGLCFGFAPSGFTAAPEVPREKTAPCLGSGLHPRLGVPQRPAQKEGCLGCLPLYAHGVHNDALCVRLQPLTLCFPRHANRSWPQPSGSLAAGGTCVNSQGICG